MQTETISISKLLPEPKNPRKDLKPGDPEYEKIKGSIKKFGFLDPIIFNTKTKKILGGHQRLKVLVADGAKELHTIQLGAYSWAFSDMELKELTPSEEHAANIALNRIGGEWDTQRLTDLLGELKAENFDISITGFDDDEFKRMLQEVNPQFNPIPEDQVPRLDERKKVICPECGHEFSPA